MRWRGRGVSPERLAHGQQRPDNAQPDSDRFWQVHCVPLSSYRKAPPQASAIRVRVEQLDLSASVRGCAPIRRPHRRHHPLPVLKERRSAVSLLLRSCSVFQGQTRSALPCELARRPRAPGSHRSARAILLRPFQFLPSARRCTASTQHVPRLADRADSGRVRGACGSRSRHRQSIGSADAIPTAPSRSPSCSHSSRPALAVDSSARIPTATIARHSGSIEAMYALSGRTLSSDVQKRRVRPGNIPLSCGSGRPMPRRTHPLDRSNHRLERVEVAIRVRMPIPYRQTRADARSRVRAGVATAPRNPSRLIRWRRRASFSGQAFSVEPRNVVVSLPAASSALAQSKAPARTGLGSARAARIEAVLRAADGLDGGVTGRHRLTRICASGYSRHAARYDSANRTRPSYDPTHSPVRIRPNRHLSPFSTASPDSIGPISSDAFVACSSSGPPKRDVKPRRIRHARKIVSDVALENFDRARLRSSRRLDSPPHPPRPVAIQSRLVPVASAIASSSEARMSEWDATL